MAGKEKDPEEARYCENSPLKVQKPEKLSLGNFARAGLSLSDVRQLDQDQHTRRKIFEANWAHQILDKISSQQTSTRHDEPSPFSRGEFLNEGFQALEETGQNFNNLEFRANFARFQTNQEDLSLESKRKHRPKLTIKIANYQND